MRNPRKPRPWNLRPSLVHPRYRWAHKGLVIPLWEGGGEPIAYNRGFPQRGTQPTASKPLWSVNSDGYMIDHDGSDRTWDFESPRWLENAPQGNFSVIVIMRVPTDAANNDNQSDFVISSGDGVEWWSISFGGALNEQFLDPQFDDNVTKVNVLGTIDVTGGDRKVVVTGRRDTNYELWIDGVLDNTAAVSNAFTVPEGVRIGGAEWAATVPPTHLEVEAVYIVPFALGEGERASLQADPFGPLRLDRRVAVIGSVAGVTAGAGGAMPTHQHVHNPTRNVTVFM